MAYVNQHAMDWPCWHKNLAADISGPNPISFFFMECYEIDGLENYSTDESGLLRRIMNVVAYIKQPEIKQWSLNTFFLI
jgi:hypothetical protein